MLFDFTRPYIRPLHFGTQAVLVSDLLLQLSVLCCDTFNFFSGGYAGVFTNGWNSTEYVQLTDKASYGLAEL